MSYLREKLHLPFLLIALALIFSIVENVIRTLALFKISVITQIDPVSFEVAFDYLVASFLFTSGYLFLTKTRMFGDRYRTRIWASSILLCLSLIPLIVAPLFVPNIVYLSSTLSQTEVSLILLSAMYLESILLFFFLYFPLYLIARTFVGGKTFAVLLANFIIEIVSVILRGYVNFFLTLSTSSLSILFLGSDTRSISVLSILDFLTLSVFLVIVLNLSSYRRYKILKEVPKRTFQDDDELVVFEK